jgi:hypothetical protein
MSKVKRARIAWKTLVSRLGGFSFFGFGASWKAPEPERDVVRSILNELEDRRVLYVNFEHENQGHVIQSLIEIRKVLTDGINRVSDSSPAVEAFRIMRASCRQFLTQPHSHPLLGQTVAHHMVTPVGEPDTEGRHVSFERKTIWERAKDEEKMKEDHFFEALGKLRGVFGQQIAILAFLYRINLAKELASTLPPEPRMDD